MTAAKIDHVVSALLEAGLLPRSAVEERRAHAHSLARSGANLLPLLASSDARPHSWLRGAQQRGASLTIGLPSQPGANAVGPRLAWWSGAVPRGPRLGVLSSRLGRQRWRNRLFFAALRDLFHTRRVDEHVWYAEQSAPAPYVERCAVLWEAPTVRVSLSATLAKWGERIQASSPVPGCVELHLSPRLVHRDLAPLHSSSCLDEHALPQRDLMIAALTDRLTALHVRPRGNLLRVLSWRLRESGHERDTLAVATSSTRPPAELQNLLDLGARELRYPKPSGEAAASGKGTARGSRPASLPEWLHSGDYLVHCTRACDGPWPDQSEVAFLDELIRGEVAVDRSALATLRRIVVQQQILASAAAIRGSAAVVCFSAVKLQELPELKTYRRHRQRWDFEPYGICIRMRWLTERGVRPVHYGDEGTWGRLDAGQRAFFQVAKGKSGIDWRAEREWRIDRSLDLATLSAADGVLFTATEDEAAELTAICRWPVIAIERPDAQGSTQ